MTQRTTLCRKGHVNPPKAKFCGTCGVKFESLVVEPSIEKHESQKFLLVGSGDTGGNVIVEYASQPELNVPANLLILETSTRDYDRFQKTLTRGHVAKIGKSAKGTLRDWKLGETLATRDPSLRDDLMAAGLESSEALFTVSSLGGGTGAGCNPVLLNVASELSPGIDRLSLVVLPADEEPDQLHFNAFCGLSRMVFYRGRRNNDLLITVSNANLEKYKVITQGYKELSWSQCLAKLIWFMTRLDEQRVHRWLDLTDLAHIGKTTGILHCVPCLATNHSLRIFGSLAGVLDSAVSRPMLDAKKETSLYSFLYLRLPTSLKDKIRPEEALKECNLWREENLSHELGGDCSISYFEEHAQRVDLLLLLVGCDIEPALARTKEGYGRVKNEILGRVHEPSHAQFVDYTTISPEEFEAIEKNWNNYISLVRAKRPAIAIEKPETPIRDQLNSRTD